jgi:protein-tyrosine phosphatase
MKILMVCLGNICRSPLAEGIMQYKAEAAGLDWKVDSAGTGNWHIGEGPHPLSQKTALHYGINIGHQRARRFRPSDPIEFDHIFFMDDNNLRDARGIADMQWQADKASLLMDLLHPGKKMAVPDPYFGNEPDYHTVFKMISEACDVFIAQHLQFSEKSSK